MCSWYSFFGFLFSVVSVSLSGTLIFILNLLDGCSMFLICPVYFSTPCPSLLLCDRFPWLYLLYLQMKFDWVHWLLELCVNTIWKFLKFSSELALSLFLTDSFFLMVYFSSFVHAAFPFLISQLIPGLAVGMSFRVEVPMVELISWQISFLREWAGCQPHTGAFPRSDCEGLCSEALGFSRKHLITGPGGEYPWLIWMECKFQTNHLVFSTRVPHALPYTASELREHPGLLL